MINRTFLIEKFVNLLLVTRVFAIHIIPLSQFLSFLAFVLLLQYFKEGFTPISLALMSLLLLQTTAEVYENITASYLLSLIGGILFLFPFKMYWLPEVSKFVGLK